MEYCAFAREILKRIHLSNTIVQSYREKSGSEAKSISAHGKAATELPALTHHDDCTPCTIGIMNTQRTSVFSGT